jgi:hypothetical protein
MHRAIPYISEHADELKQRHQHEHDRHKKPRLQMLYLLASGQVHTRQVVVRPLGVHRNTVGRWRSMPLEVWMPCWPAMFPPANRSRLRPRCSPALSRPSAARKTSPPMSQCASGCDGEGFPPCSGRDAAPVGCHP